MDTLSHIYTHPVTVNCPVNHLATVKNLHISFILILLFNKVVAACWCPSCVSFRWRTLLIFLVFDLSLFAQSSSALLTLTTVSHISQITTCFTLNLYHRHCKLKHKLSRITKILPTFWEESSRLSLPVLQVFKVFVRVQVTPMSGYLIWSDRSHWDLLFGLRRSVLRRFCIRRIWELQRMENRSGLFLVSLLKHWDFILRYIEFNKIQHL